MCIYIYIQAPLVAQRQIRLQCRRPPATEEVKDQSLGGEDPLEKEIAIIAVFLPGKSHGQRSLVSYSPWGFKSQT